MLYDVVPRLVSILDPYLPVFPTSKKTRRSLRNAVASLKIERPRGTVFVDDRIIVNDTKYRYIKPVPFAPMGILPSGWYSGILQEVIFQDDYQIGWYIDFS